MIKPTIGRKIWYWDSPEDRKNGADPYDGNIVFVVTDRLITVAGFDHEGDLFKAERVVLLQDDDPEPAEGPFAIWMPYQVAADANRKAREASASA